MSGKIIKKSTELSKVELSNGEVTITIEPDRMVDSNIEVKFRDGNNPHRHCISMNEKALGLLGLVVEQYQVLNSN